MIPQTRSFLIYAGIALLSLTAGGGVARWVALQASHETTVPNQAITKIGIPEYRPEFVLNDLSGAPRRLSEWDGKVILLNFWATWCPPCRTEMPDFVELREELHAQGRAFEVIGVAIDQAEPVEDFVNEIAAEYPILLAELEGLKIMREYGNQLTTLPYTVIIDKNRKIVQTFRNEVTKSDVLQIIRPLFKHP